MPRADGSRHCTVQSISPPWVGCLDLMHLDHLKACAALTMTVELLNLLPHGLLFHQEVNQHKSKQVNEQTVQLMHELFKSYVFS